MPDPSRMQCMEIWGGNASVDTSVSVSGLDAWVYSKPYLQSSAGGDVHYVSSCATGRITRLLVADVSGHGTEVDAIARDLRDLMRRYVNYLDQAEFVKHMNTRFAEMSASNIFATAIVTTFFTPTRLLTLCNAGHPAPLLYTASTGQWSIIDHPPSAASPSDSTEPANLPLGIFDISLYDHFEIPLAPGDIVLVYTDSLMESSRPDGSQLNPEGLRDLLTTLPPPTSPSDPAQLIPALLESIRTLHPGNLDSDDITVLAFRPNGTGATMAPRDKLLAPFRVLKGLLSSLARGGKGFPFPELSLVNIGGALFPPLNKRWSPSHRPPNTPNTSTTHPKK